MLRKILRYSVLLYVCAFVTVSGAWCGISRISKGYVRFENPEESTAAVIKLDGEWEFYWNRLLDTVYLADPDGAIPFSRQRVYPDSLETIPGFWKKTIGRFSGKNTSFAAGTYRLLLVNLVPGNMYGLVIRESPGTSCAVFANGKKICEAGSVSADPAFSKPCVRPLYAQFPADGHGVIELIIQVSNGVHRKGGLWDSVLFGDRDNIFQYYNTQSGIAWFIIGTLLFLGLFNLLQFILTPARKQYLYFAVFVFVLALRIAVAGFSVATVAFPSIPYGLQLKLEYLALWLAPVAFMQLICKLYPVALLCKKAGIRYEKKLRMILICAVFACGAASLVLPIRYANYMVPYLEIGALCILLYVFWILLLCARSRQTYIRLYFLSFLLIASGFLADVVFTSRRGILPVSPMPVLLFFFAVFHFLLLAKRQSAMHRERLELVDTMQKLNDAYVRFVPREFLKLLNKHSIIDITLGDHVQTEMSIVFSKIQISTESGDHVSPEEQYAIFSGYLKAVSPVITRHNGFVSKFISGGFIALFPGSADDALAATVEMLGCLATENQHCLDDKKMITAGTGIHFGKMILGTIGEENRLDDTVISDTVNTVSRIETVCETLNRPVVISAAAKEHITETEFPDIHFLQLDAILVKGKQKPLDLYECRLVVPGDAK